jgi:signal peptidase I
MIVSVIVALLVGTLAGLIINFDVRVQRVGSGSMEPVLPVGALVITYKTAALHVNDIITFRNPETGGTTTHVFGGYAKDGSLLTRGVANPSADNFSPRPLRGDVVGVVWRHVDVFAVSFWMTARGAAILMLLLIIGMLLLSGRLEQPRTSDTTSPV